MARLLSELVQCWMALGGLSGRFTPDLVLLKRGLRGASDPCRPGADAREIVAWEVRYGRRLPDGLRAWLMISDGLVGSGPLIHPLRALGPMDPLPRHREMVAPPAGWFELGTLADQTIGIDLAYSLPGGGCPIFTPGDDVSASRARIIARNFEEWFLNLLSSSGQEYWLDPEFDDFGDPWEAHFRHAGAARGDSARLAPP
jgi:cell wall assembly regulator SMI1